MPCRIGRAKAAVFPLPVSASPIRSRPWSARGIASAWIGVGILYPRAAHASQRGSMMPRALNVLFSVAVSGTASGTAFETASRPLCGAVSGVMTEEGLETLRSDTPSWLSFRLLWNDISTDEVRAKLGNDDVSIMYGVSCISLEPKMDRKYIEMCAALIPPRCPLSQKKFSILHSQLRLPSLCQPYCT
jgi:hypothetical protein